MKHRLRLECRQRRRALGRTLRISNNRAINQAVQELVALTGTTTLAAFFPFDGEPDVRPALDILARRGIRVALPVIVDEASGEHLQFRLWDPDIALVKNPFGIEEPGEGDVIHLADLDLLLMPLVAWDQQGNRLGMGAGYYDRALESLADSTRPRRVGIAFEVQKVAGIPADPWDVRLHEVITENGRFTCTA